MQVVTERLLHEERKLRECDGENTLKLWLENSLWEEKAQSVTTAEGMDISSVTAEIQQRE